LEPLNFFDPLFEAEKLFYCFKFTYFYESNWFACASASSMMVLRDRTCQNIGFFRLKILQFIANKFGKYFETDVMVYHLFTNNPGHSVQRNSKARIARRVPSLFESKLKVKIWADFVK